MVSQPLILRPLTGRCQRNTQSRFNIIGCSLCRGLREPSTTGVATDSFAEAKLAGGEYAHTILHKWQGMGGETGVLENVSYFAAAQ